MIATTSALELAHHVTTASALAGSSSHLLLHAQAGALYVGAASATACYRGRCGADVALSGRSVVSISSLSSAIPLCAYERAIALQIQGSQIAIGIAPRQIFLATLNADTFPDLPSAARYGADMVPPENQAHISHCMRAMGLCTPASSMYVGTSHICSACAEIGIMAKVPRHGLGQGRYLVRTAAEIARILAQESVRAGAADGWLFLRQKGAETALRLGGNESGQVLYQAMAERARMSRSWALVDRQDLIMALSGVAVVAQEAIALCAGATLTLQAASALGQARYGLRTQTRGPGAKARLPVALWHRSASMIAGPVLDLGIGEADTVMASADGSLLLLLPHIL